MTQTQTMPHGVMDMAPLSTAYTPYVRPESVDTAHTIDLVERAALHGETYEGFRLLDDVSLEAVRDAFRDLLKQRAALAAVIAVVDPQALATAVARAGNGRGIRMLDFAAAMAAEGRA